jgi:hypothetical protein
MALHLARCARLQRLPLRVLAVPIGSSEVSFENMKRILYLSDRRSCMQLLQRVADVPIVYQLDAVVHL